MFDNFCMTRKCHMLRINLVYCFLWKNERINFFMINNKLGQAYLLNIRLLDSKLLRANSVINCKFLKKEKNNKFLKMPLLSYLNDIDSNSGNLYIFFAIIYWTKFLELMRSGALQRRWNRSIFPEKWSL